MHTQWSESTRNYTRLAFENLSFASREGKVWLKNISGQSGYINDDDAICGFLTVRMPDGVSKEEFDSIEDLIAHGWVLD